MTNKEKYPNAQIIQSAYGFYISLEKNVYLVNGRPSDDCTMGWHTTHEKAQLALDNFMNEKKPVTLDEIFWP